MEQKESTASVDWSSTYVKMSASEEEALEPSSSHLGPPPKSVPSPPMPLPIQPKLCSPHLTRFVTQLMFDCREGGSKLFLGGLSWDTSEGEPCPWLANNLPAPWPQSSSEPPLNPLLPCRQTQGALWGIWRSRGGGGYAGPGDRQATGLWLRDLHGPHRGRPSGEGRAHHGRQTD